MRALCKAAVLALAIIAVCAQSGVPAYAGPEGKRVALFIGPTQDKFLGGITRGVTDAAAAKGMKVTVFSSPFDPTLQAQQIDDAVAQKFDMLILQPISQKAVVPPLTRAKAANIPVVLVVVPLTDASSQDLYLSYAGYDDRALGSLAGEAMARQLTDTGHKEANVAILAGSMDEGKAPIRQKAFVAALESHPGFKVVATEDTKWNPVTAETMAGQLLARFASNGIAGIYGMNDTLANASIQAIVAAGLKPGTKPGNIIVVGGNCQGVGIENIKNGKMATTLLDNPVDEGKLAADKVADYFNGAKLDKAYYLKVAEPITAANVAAFEKPCTY